jgi:YQGE family putative transporter
VFPQIFERLVDLFGRANRGIRVKFARLGSGARTLLLLVVLYYTAVSLSAVFVNVYFYKIKSSFPLLATYHVFRFAVLLIVFSIGGYVAKAWNPRLPFRVAIFVYALFYALVLRLKSDAIHYIKPLGALEGVAQGLFFCALHTLAFDYTEDSTRDYFYGLNASLLALAGILSPFLAGFVISRFTGLTGYYYIFSATLVLFLVIIALSFQLRRTYQRARYQLFAFLLSFKNVAWNRVMAAHLVHGATSGFLLFIVSLLVYYATQSEFTVGNFQAMVAALAFGATYVLAHVITPQRRLRFFFVGAIMTCAALVILALRVSFLNLMGYGLLYAVFQPFIYIPMVALTFAVIDQDPRAPSDRVEYLVCREYPIGIGRLLSLGLFLIGYHFLQLGFLRILLVLLGLSQFGSYLLFRNVAGRIASRTGV